MAAAEPFTRAWVDVDLGALRRNGEALARRAGVPLLPMVKADAYGLGVAPVVAALEPLEPWGYGVATVAEGAELRALGVRRPVVVFTPVLRDDFARASAASLTLALGDAALVREWAGGGGRWHLAVDTGMSRAGVDWREMGAIVDVATAFPPEGAFTHFHSAERNDGSREVQERRFREALALLPVPPRVVHVENSPALVRAAPSPWAAVRPGIFLYGVGSGAGELLRPEPVAHLRARIVELRSLRDGDTVSYDATYRAVGPRRIATLAVGYADGYRRALSNRGTALLNGGRAPVAGLVTMDMTMLDVTDVPCAVGDVATLVGRDGADLLEVEEVARVADVSPYELLTGLRLRAPRVYADGAPSARGG